MLSFTHQLCKRICTACVTVWICHYWWSNLPNTLHNRVLYSMGRLMGIVAKWSHSQNSIKGGYIWCYYQGRFCTLTDAGIDFSHGKLGDGKRVSCCCCCNIGEINAWQCRVIMQLKNNKEKWLLIILSTLLGNCWIINNRQKTVLKKPSIVYS